MHRLQIDQLWDVRMRENVMAATDTPQLEAQRLGESAKVAKRNIGHIAAGEALEELALIHRGNVLVAWDGTLSPHGEASPELQTAHYLDGYRIGLIEQQ